MNSKQNALIYLRDEADNLATLCNSSISVSHKKDVTQDLEQQVGILFAAIKEVIDEFKLDEAAVETAVYAEHKNRQKTL